jgi:hypothetical protein
MYGKTKRRKNNISIPTTLATSENKTLALEHRQRVAKNASTVESATKTLQCIIVASARQRRYVELGHSSHGHVQLEPALLILAIGDALNYSEF